MKRWRAILGASPDRDHAPPVPPVPPKTPCGGNSGGNGGIGGRHQRRRLRPTLHLVWNADEGFTVTPEDAVFLTTGCKPSDRSNT